MTGEREAGGGVAAKLARVVLRFGSLAVWLKLGPFVDRFVGQRVYVRLAMWALRHKGVSFTGTPLWIASDAIFDIGGERIEVGDRCVVSRQVLLLTHDFSLDRYVERHGDPVLRSDDELEVVHHAPIRIGDYAFLGPRVIVLPGVTIGPGAIVAAGSTVTKDVPADTVWAGNPARQIRTAAELAEHRRASFEVTRRRR